MSIPRRHFLSIGLFILVVIGSGVGAYSVVMQFLTATTDQTTSQTPGGSDTADESTVKQEDKDLYTVPSDAPRLLTIDTLNITARVYPMGISKQGLIDAPHNIHDVGWYRGSVQPGAKGVTFIDGHVSGPSKDGVFKRMGTLTSGDEITIETGDKSRYRYTVRKVETKPVAAIDMSTVLKGDVNTHSLVLMTCAGVYDREQNAYEKRVIVYANQRKD